ncbi:hypothetical protein WA026_018739 [Henosepilachna vigintioctopunctata]|uniref:BESS domain-containing protein n=1 Tax=Henosepilachna vigintioctopunctata TaxID=420089 RepID=A0AAW1TQI9_9CUCU
MPDESAASAEEVENVGGSDLGHLSTPKPPKSRRRPANDIVERQMSSAFEQLTNMLAKRQKENQPPLTEQDDCELYGKLLTQKLRELPPDDRKLMMYDIDTLFVNRIKEKQRYETTSSYHSVPYQWRVTSSMPNRPPTPQTPYSETVPNTSPYLNHRLPQPRTLNHRLHANHPLPECHIMKQQLNRQQKIEPSSLQSIQSHYISQLDLTNYTTPPIKIISDELIAPQTRPNIINEALFKAYEDSDNYNK